MMPPLLKLLRPQQWSKNIFVFLPLFFDKKLTDLHVVAMTVVCAVVFSLAASSVYCLNDIMDREADAMHPVKCKRPIASGQVSVAAGWGAMALCAVLALILTASLLPHTLLWLLLGYLLLNVAYSLWLKHLALVDVLVVAVFYVMRILAGAMTGDIELSHWIVVMTFLLALFLVLGKRRDDVRLNLLGGAKVRKGTAQYNLEFLNMCLTTVATITIIAYIMYTISPEVVRRFDNHYIYTTTVFVLAGLLRYMQIAVVGNQGGSPPRVLFQDHFIQLCVVGWVLAFVFIIYF